MRGRGTPKGRGSDRGPPLGRAVPEGPSGTAVFLDVPARFVVTEERGSLGGSRDRDRQVRAAGLRVRRHRDRPQPAHPRSRRRRHHLGDRRVQGSSCRSSPRRWTASCRRRPRSRSGNLGGLGCLNLEGLWTRYDDPEPLFEEIATCSTREGDAAHAGDLRRADQGRADRPAHPRDQGGRRHRVCASLTPQRVEQYSEACSRPSSTCS